MPVVSRDNNLWAVRTPAGRILQGTVATSKRLALCNFLSWHLAGDGILEVSSRAVNEVLRVRQALKHCSSHAPLDEVHHLEVAPVLKVLQRNRYNVVRVVAVSMAKRENHRKVMRDANRNQGPRP